MEEAIAEKVAPARDIILRKMDGLGESSSLWRRVSGGGLERQPCSSISQIRKAKTTGDCAEAAVMPAGTRIPVLVEFSGPT